METKEKKSRGVKRFFETVGYVRSLSWLLGVIVATVYTVISARREDYSVTAALILGGMAVATIVVVSVGILWFLDRVQKRRSEQRTPEEVEHAVREWLHKYQYFASGVPQKKEGLDFIVHAHDDMDNSFTVLKNSTEPFITIAAVMDISPKDVAQFPFDAQPYFAEVGLRLLQLGVNYRTTPTPPSVEVSTMLMADASLHEFTFLDAIGGVKRALVMVRLLTGRTLHEVREARKAKGQT